MPADEISKKRKDVEDDVDPGASRDQASDGDDDDDSIVNVDFDFFSPKEDDFHSLKNLLRQLLDVDNVEFDLSSVTQLIIDQAFLGSTIKTDGEESDPFALLTVLNMTEHRQKPAIKALADYFIRKTQDNADFNRRLRKLFASSSKERVGLILSERLVNMPTEVVPPMYKMLADEIDAAIANKEPFEVDYFIVLSRKFTEEESELDKEDSRPSKKRNAKSTTKEAYYFHPEDEVLEKKALYTHNYPFSRATQDSDSRRAFQEYGISPVGSLILISNDKLPEAIAEMQAAFPY